MNTKDSSIVLIKFNANSVYVQYKNYESDTLSYSKAKSIFKDLTYKIRYSSCGTTKAMDFCNSISRRKYLITENTIEPKPYIPVPFNGRGKKR